MYILVETEYITVWVLRKYLQEETIESISQVPLYNFELKAYPFLSENLIIQTSQR